MARVEGVPINIEIAFLSNDVEPLLELQLKENPHWTEADKAKFRRRFEMTKTLSDEEVTGIVTLNRLKEALRKKGIAH